jgi:hypothetical protein
MDHCEVCERELEIAYSDWSRGPTIPYASGFLCPCGAWMGTFAPLLPFAYRELGGEWHRVSDGTRLTA